MHAVVVHDADVTNEFSVEGVSISVGSLEEGNDDITSGFHFAEGQRSLFGPILWQINVV